MSAPLPLCECADSTECNPASVRCRTFAKMFKAALSEELRASRQELVDALVTVKKLAEDLLEARDVADDLAAIVRTLRHDGDLGPQGLAALDAWQTAWEHDND